MESNNRKDHLNCLRLRSDDKDDPYAGVISRGAQECEAPLLKLLIILGGSAPLTILALFLLFVRKTLLIFPQASVMLALTRLSAKLLIVLIQNTDSLSCNYVV